VLVPRYPDPLPERLAPHPGDPRSARHSRVGCPGAREVEVVPLNPHGAASPSVSAAALPCVDGRSPPLASLHAAAALTIFDGQAVFARLPGRITPLVDAALFRFVPGSRTIIVAGEQP
jgi:hypothetical protein